MARHIQDEKSKRRNIEQDRASHARARAQPGGLVFTARERHTLAYVLDLGLQRDGNDLLWDIIHYPVKTPTEFYWEARALGTMGRLYREVVEALA